MNKSEEFSMNCNHCKAGITRRSNENRPSFYVMLGDAIMSSGMRSGTPERTVDEVAEAYLQHIRAMSKVCDPWNDRMRAEVMDMQPSNARRSTGSLISRHDGPQRVVVIVGSTRNSTAVVYDAIRRMQWLTDMPVVFSNKFSLKPIKLRRTVYYVDTVGGTILDSLAISDEPNLLPAIVCVLPELDDDDRKELQIAESLHNVIYYYER